MLIFQVKKTHMGNVHFITCRFKGFKNRLIQGLSNNVPRKKIEKYHTPI